MSGVEIQLIDDQIICLVDQYGKVLAATALKDNNLNSLYCYHLKGWQGPCPDCPVGIETKNFFRGDMTLAPEDMLDLNLNKAGFLVKLSRDGKELVSPLLLNIGNATSILRLMSLVQKTLITNQELERDFELGGSIQSYMMTTGWANPVAILDLFYKPYNKVSGDIFDIQEDQTRGIFFIIGDVTGHGVGPALIGTYIKSFVYQHLSREEKMDLSSFATYMNKELSRLIRSGDFITMFMGYIHLPDLRLEFICMGHPQPFLYRDGELIEIVENIRHVPLLLVDDMKYDSSSINLKKNDILLLYTDGVIDIENKKKEKLGISGLRDMFFNTAQSCANQDKCLLSTGVHEELRKFADGDNYLDDITLASIKIMDNIISKPMDNTGKEEVKMSELDDLFRRK